MRKLNFDVAPDASHSTDENKPVRPTQLRPLLGLKPEARPTGALGSISRSLGDLSEKARRADEIEQKLVQGFAVVELAPDIVDSSFIADRMAGSEDDFLSFRETIKSAGQNSPILVRPHTKTEGRYEVAFGHRRLRAARELGLKVRAVVRPLSNEELVIAQGQENSARTDLTYMERARFAAQLEERSFSREIIMSALSIDKAALSKLIAIATRIPVPVVEAIGPAPGLGRQRWAELAEMLESEEAKRKALHFVQASGFADQPSDKRFLALHEALRSKVTRARAEAWTAPDGTRAAQVQKGDKRLSLIFDERVAPAFGDYVKSRLQELYEDYKKRSGN